MFIGLIIISIVAVLSGRDADFGKGGRDKEVFALGLPNATYDITSYYRDETLYVFSDMNAKEAKAYIQKIKDSGFTHDSFSDDDYNYTGTDEEGRTIVFDYDEETKMGTITAIKDKKTLEQKGEGQQ